MNRHADPAAPWAFVVNPVHAAGLRRLAEASSLLDARGIPYSVSRTTRVREGAEQAAAAVRSGAARLVVIGGDGTVRSTVRGLLSADSGAAPGTVPLLIVPTGTANLFARNLGIRPGPVQPARLFSTRCRSADVGTARVRNRWGWESSEVFLAAAGLGEDARTVMALTDRLKHRLGWPAYLLRGARFLRSPGIRARVRIPGGELDGPVWSVLAGNISRAPAGIRVFPHGGPGSGDLELLVCTPPTLAGWSAIAAYGLGLRSGVPADLAYHRTPRAHLVPASPTAVHLDGEPFPEVVEMDLGIAAGALSVVV